MEAARILARVPGDRLSEKDRSAFAVALEEYVTGQQAVDDQPGAHLNLGVLYTHLARLADAEKEYQTAVAIDPHFVPARINLAMLYDQRDEKPKAEAQFHAAIGELKQQLADTERQATMTQGSSSPGGMPSRGEAAGRHGIASEAAPQGPQGSKPASAAVKPFYVPVFATNATAMERPLERLIEQLRQQLGETYYSLGLLVAEDEKRLQEAADSLATAAKLMPANGRVRYNLGLALQRLGQAKAAEEALVSACRLAPAEPDYVKALTLHYAQQRDWRKALTCAEELVRLAPGDREYRALLDLVRRESK
jgi:Flp pilus assembly protein TadD